MSKTELFVDASGIWCMDAQPYGMAWADIYQVWGYTLEYPEIGPQLELELTTQYGANLIIGATWSGFDKVLDAISEYLFLPNNDWQQRAKAITANDEPYLIWSQAPSDEPQPAAPWPAMTAVEVTTAIAHFIEGKAYCIAKGFIDSHGKSWLSAGLLYYCGNEFNADKQLLRLHFNEDTAPLSITLALTDTAQYQVLQQFETYLPLAFTLNNSLIKQLTPLWQAAAQQPARPLQVANLAQLQATIPDTQLLFTEVFARDELATIAARFAPFLYHEHYLPISSSDYEQLIVLGYGAENAGQVAYFDFDFGLCPLHSDLASLLAQLFGR